MIPSSSSSFLLQAVNRRGAEPPGPVLHHPVVFRHVRRFSRLVFQHNDRVPIQQREQPAEHVPQVCHPVRRIQENQAKPFSVLPERRQRRLPVAANQPCALLVSQRRQVPLLNLAGFPVVIDHHREIRAPAQGLQAQSAAPGKQVQHPA